MAIHLGAAYVDIVPSTKGLGRELSGQLVPEVSAAGGAAGRGFGARFASAVGGLVSGAATVAGATAGTLFATSLTKGFGRLKAIDAAQFKLKGLGHDAKSVEAIMSSALKAVEGTAFGLGDAATIAASAVAAGIEPGKELTRYLSLIGDTATIAGGSLEEIGGIINGVTTTNQVYRRDLLQLANRGLPVFTWLQEAYGVTGEELNKMVSSGKIDAETFLDVIEKNIGGAALSAGDSWDGMVANVGAAMGRFGAKILEPLMVGFKAVAPAVMGLFDELGARVGPAMESFADSHYFQEFVYQFERLAGMVGPALDSLGGLAPLLAPVAGFVGAKGLGGLVGLVPGLSGLAGALNPFVGAVVGLVLASEPLRTVLMDVFWTLANSFRSVFETLAPVLSNVLDVLGGAVAEAFRAFLDGIGPALPAIMDAFAAIAESLGEILIALAPVIPQLAELAAVLIETIGVPVLEAIAWAVGELATGLTEMGPAFPIIVSGLMLTKAAFAALTAVMAVNPFVLLGAAIAAVVAGLVWAYQNVGWFRDAVQTAVQFVVDFGRKIGELAVAVWDAAGSLWEWAQQLPERIGAAIRAVIDWVSRLPERIGGVIRAVIDWFASLPGKIVSALGDFASTVGEWFVEGLQKLPYLVGYAIGTAVGVFVGLPALILTGLNALGNWLWTEWLGPAISALPGLISSGFSAVVTWFQKLPGNIVSWVGDLGSSLWGVFTAALSYVVRELSVKGAELFSWFAGLPGKIVETVGDVGSTLLAKGTDILGGLWRGARDVFVEVGAWFAGLPSAIVGYLGGAGTWLVGVGKDVLQGFWDGVEPMVGWVGAKVSSIIGVISGAWKAISGVVSGAIGAISRALDVSWASISGVVSSTWAAITGAISGAWGTVTSTVSTAVETVSTTLSNAWSAITGGVSSVVSTIGAQFTGLPETLRRALATVGETIAAPFRTAWGAIARVWNSTVGSLSFTIPSWVPGLGGRGFSMPKLPTYHVGGVVGTGVTGDEAIVKVMRGEWILTPEQVGRLAGAAAPAPPAADRGRSGPLVSVTTGADADSVGRIVSHQLRGF